MSRSIWARRVSVRQIAVSSKLAEEIDGFRKGGLGIRRPLVAPGPFSPFARLNTLALTVHQAGPQRLFDQILSAFYQNVLFAPVPLAARRHPPTMGRGIAVVSTMCGRSEYGHQARARRDAAERDPRVSAWLRVRRSGSALAGARRSAFRPAPFPAVSASDASRRRTFPQCAKSHPRRRRCSHSHSARRSTHSPAGAALGARRRQVRGPVSYTHLRAHETGRNLVCRLLLE